VLNNINNKENNSKPEKVAYTVTKRYMLKHAQIRKLLASD